MSEYEKAKAKLENNLIALFMPEAIQKNDVANGLDKIARDYIQAADKEIAQWKKAKELVEKQLTKLSIECADIRLSADKEIATKDAELARLREEARNWRSVAERLEREKQLKW